MCDNNTNIDIDTVSVRPLTFWKEHQARFPAIAALARDTLSFPATGAGVERLFNTARDICHYRRGRMKSETVEALMMFLCTTKFDMEEQEATLLEKFFSQDELEAAKEEREEKLSEIEVDPISDTEEQEDELEDKPGDAIEVVIEDRPEDIPEERPLPTSEYGRPCSPSLPPTCTQTRASGRKRKSREDDLFEYH